MIRDWVFIAAAALAMRVAPTVIWSDSWGGPVFFSGPTLTGSVAQLCYAERHDFDDQGAVLAPSRM